MPGWASGIAFGDLVAGCRKLGMAVIARTDPHATYDDVEQAHPDWIAVDSTGRQRRHWASPEMWVTCALGPYNFEFMREVHREIMTRYRVNGIFINRWEGSGMCFCEHCKSQFKAASGFDLPTTKDPQSPARRAYILWRQKRLFDLWRLWDSDVREINPDSCVIPNTGGGATSSLDMKTIGELAPILFADRQGRSGLMAPWSSGKNGKEYRSTMGRKPIGGIFSVGVEEAYRWKDSVQSPAEIRLWAHRRHRQRAAPLVHQVRRHDPRPALAEGRRRSLPLAPSEPRNTCATRPRWRASVWSTRSRPRGSMVDQAPRRTSKTMSWAGTRPSSKPAFPSRWFMTVFSTPSTSPRSRR